MTQTQPITESGPQGKGKCAGCGLPTQLWTYTTRTGFWQVWRDGEHRAHDTVLCRLRQERVKKEEG